jgi:hypothetical protein
MPLQIPTKYPERKPPIGRRVRYLGTVRARRSHILTRVYRVAITEIAA